MSRTRRTSKPDRTPPLSFPRRIADIVRLPVVMVFLCLCAHPLASQEIDMDAVEAFEEFRFGVTAFHDGLYSQSILSFERSLAYKSDDLRTVTWLGHAYYRLGYEDTALELWQRVIDEGGADATLQYLVETVTYRRGIGRELGSGVRYVDAFELEGTKEDYRLFSRPSSVYPSRDGGFYLASFAGNRVLRFNANAAVTRQYLGGLSGLDHPFDMVETEEGYLFVSEFTRHAMYRSDTLGQEVVRFGERGAAPGQLLAPQYLTVDDSGYLYITESGNRRVSKFDFDGNFVLEFGKPRDGFSGFRNPTGIVYHRDRVYVVDQRDRGIHLFDTSGNYIDSILVGELIAPEGLSVYDDGTLLLADTRDIKLVDTENETSVVVFRSDDPDARLTKAVLDENGHIIVSDFTRNIATVLSEVSSIYTGLLVEIERVDATEFPQVTLAVSVHTRDGAPLVGLDESNFILTERSGSVDAPVMLDLDASVRSRMAIVVEGSERLDASSEAVAESVGSLLEQMRGIGGAALYVAGQTPRLLGANGIIAQNPVPNGTLLEALSSVVPVGTEWRVGAGVRLAANELTAFPGSRSIVLVTSGSLGETAFAEYPPDLLAAFLKNNGIRLYCVYSVPDPADRETLDYLCEETGGRSLYLYRAAGVGEIADLASQQPTGRYFFQYDSRSDTDFGNAYIPVQVETLFYRRTGRGGSAYFPPIEY